GGGDCNHAIDGQFQPVRAQRGWPCGQLDYYRLCRDVDEDVLPVYPGGVVERQGRIADPPAVPVMSSGRGTRRVVAAAEGAGAVGSAPDGVLDPCRWHDVPARYLAALEEQLAEPGDIAERRADAAVGHGISVRVQGDLRIEFGAHRLPEFGGDELMQPRPGRPLDDPGQYVGEDRAVTELPAMRPVVPQCGEVAKRVSRPRLACVRAPQVHPLIGAHVGLRIVIVLVEPRACPHIEQMLDGGPLE